MRLDFFWEERGGGQVRKEEKREQRRRDGRTLTRPGFLMDTVEGMAWDPQAPSDFFRSSGFVADFAFLDNPLVVKLLGSVPVVRTRGKALFALSRFSVVVDVVVVVNAAVVAVVLLLLLTADDVGTVVAWVKDSEGRTPTSFISLTSFASVSVRISLDSLRYSRFIVTESGIGTSLTKFSSTIHGCSMTSCNPIRSETSLFSILWIRSVTEWPNSFG